MKIRNGAALVAAGLLISACGGGGSNNMAPTNPSPTYYFVTPALNAQYVYAQTIVDNSANTINETVALLVTAVQGSGAYTEQQSDPTGTVVTVNGVTYSVLDESINFNPEGQATTYSFMPANGSLTTCTYTPSAGGLTYPTQVGTTWTTNYTLSCGSAAPVSYTHTGVVADVEAVTVPAGTFQALKVMSTITWTDANGTTRTQNATNWRDVNTGLSVQSVTTTAYSGTPVSAASYPVSNTRVLQSMS